MSSDFSKDRKPPAPQGITGQAAPQLPRLLHLTLVDAIRTTAVKHVAETWSQLALRLTKRPISTRDRENTEPSVDLLGDAHPAKPITWALIVPFKMLTVEEGAVLNDYGHGPTYSRRKANVVQADVLCLDIDNDPKLGRPTLSVDGALELFRGKAFALYTTHNHLNPNKGNVDKFRVMFPLVEPVSYDELVERKAALKELFPFSDPASFVMSQPFFVPMAHPDRASNHRTHEGKGEWFDLLALPAVVQETKPTTAPSTYVQTGDTFADLPFIKLAPKHGGQTYRADELYNLLKDGYDDRRGCYRIGGSDSKPGCYIFRKGSGLLYFDGGQKQFIKVMRVKRAGGYDANPFEEEDVETPTTLWTRKPQPPRTVAQASDTTVVELLTTGPLLKYAAPTTIARLNQRYLPDDLHERIPLTGITVVRSPKGTGKTEVLGKLTRQAERNGESVMLLGHRIYLLNNLAVRTNLDFYLDLGKGELTREMALCMNSLTRFDPEVDEPYDTIIIDESEQVFQALTSSPMQRDSNVIFKNLCYLFKRAKRIICLDADLSAELTIELIQEIRGIKEADAVLGVINDYQIGAGQTTKMYEQKWHLLADAVAAVERGEKVFISCNSIKFATAVDAAITQLLGKKSLLLTSETNDTDAAHAFIEDPTNESTKYDVVVASPTLSTGVSIDGNHFTKVFGFFGFSPGTYQDADQALSRVRNCTDVSVWVQGNVSEQNLPTEEALYDAALATERGSMRTLHGEEVPPATQGQLLWARIYARIAFMTRVWSFNKDEQFAGLRQELGFNIEFILNDEELSAAGKSVWASFKNAGVDRAPEIFNATELDPEDAIALGQKRQRTREERNQLDRYHLYSHLKEDWTVETVRRALQQELLRSLNRIAVLHNLPDEVIRGYDIDDRHRNDTTFTANRHRVMQRQLINHLCHAANLDLDHLLEQAQGEKEVEVPRTTLGAIAKAYEAKKREFNFYFKSRIADPTDEKNLKKVWDATFADHLSLLLVKKKRGTAKQREYRYYLDLEKKDLIHKALAASEF